MPHLRHRFFMKFRGRNAHPNRVEKPPSGNGGADPPVRPTNPGGPVFHGISVAVGMPVARHPPHRSVRALLTHTVLTSDVLTQSVPRIRMQDLDFRYEASKDLLKPFPRPAGSLTPPAKLPPP